MGERSTAEVVAGLVAGLELAVVHLARTVAARTGTTTEELAASFDATAAALGESVRNVDLVRLSLKHAAAGLRNADGSDGLAAEVERLLH